MPVKPGPATLARLAGAVLIAVVVWSCGSPAPTSTPAPTGAPSPADLASPSPESSVLDATGFPGIYGEPTGTPEITINPPTAGEPATPGPTPRRQTVTIVAAGDIACDPGQNVGQPTDCDQAATADLIGAVGPTAVLTLGDNQYENGTLAGFQKVFGTTWGKYRSIMYPAIGNHEYLTKGAAGYFGYFGLPAYYSYTLGDWHMISLDSECQYVGGCAAGSKQEKWLLADLAAHPSYCTLVYWHEPRWSSGEHGDASQMKTIWADLVAAKVDVVLTGHNHDYERFTPLDATGNPDPLGTTEFVVGTGGKNHYGFAVSPLKGELVRNDTSFGIIRMSLGPTGYNWKFLPAPGYTFTDSGSASCH